MKKLILSLSILSLGLVGCSSNDQSRIEWIEQKFKTREIFLYGIRDHSIYIVRLPDGSVLLVQRSNTTTPEKLTYRQIFAPNK